MLPNLMVFEQCMPFRKLLAHSDYKSLLHELMIYVYLNPCNENLKNIDKKDRFNAIHVYLVLQNGYIQPIHWFEILYSKYPNPAFAQNSCKNRNAKSLKHKA